jgi:hypothetical protein
VVRPIDMQDNLSKTQAVERMNQIQKSSGEIGQRTAANALKARTQAELEKTRASEKTDMVIIHHDKEKDQKEDQDKKKKQDETDETEETPPDHLDLQA